MGAKRGGVWRGLVEVGPRWCLGSVRQFGSVWQFAGDRGSLAIRGANVFRWHRMFAALLWIGVRSLFPILLSMGWAFAEPTSLPDAVSGPNRHTFRLVLPAHFQMGTLPWETFRKDHTQPNENDAQPRHPVILTRPFYAGVTEVTVGQFAAFVADSDHSCTADFGVVGWRPSGEARDMNRRDFVTGESFSWRDPGFEQTDDHPVTCVSHADALAYCQWLSDADPNASYRLPTEAEWELAANGGDDSTHFFFGDDYQHQIARYANVADRSLEQSHAGRGLEQWLFDPDDGPDDGFACTAPVASYRPNAFGLHDMHGNVWEWCQDQYLDTWYERFPRRRHGEVRPRAVDPVCQTPWNEHGPWHVIRGGSFINPPLQSRSATRGVLHGRDATCYVGFRVVRDVAPDEARPFVESHRSSEAALAAWTEAATQVREYDDGVLRFECRAEQIDADSWQTIADLQFAFELTLRPPGSVLSSHLGELASAAGLRGVRIATRIDGFDDQSLAWLTGAKRLQSFQLTSHPDAQDAATLANLRQANRLESLMLSGSGVTDEGLAGLSADTPLKTLHVAGTACRGETLGHFGSRSLEEISIALSDDGASQAAEHRSLMRINASEGTLSENGVESLSRLRHLQRLTLRDCKAIERVPPPSIARMRNLVSLDVRGVSLDDHLIDAAITLNHLRELSLSVPPKGSSIALSSSGWKRVNQLIGLRSLTVEGSDPVIDAETLKGWLEMPNLDRLVLHRAICDVTDTRMDELISGQTEVRVEIR